MAKTFKFLLSGLKINRGYKKWGGDIDAEALERVYNNQGGKCKVTGVVLQIPTWSKYKINSICRASVDRIDNSKGYTEDNIQFVCQMYNFCRNTNNHESVVKFCEELLKNEQSKL